VAFPDLPTVSEAGVSGYEAAQRSGIWVPAKTPPAIINRLQREIAQVARSADVRARFGQNGVEPVGSSPQEFAATIKSEVARISKLIKDANLRTQ
jgi:tripartite-type tricarboxylate transporter receptor subunit TctC